ncbi:MAG: hypothetical protein R6T85_03820 [Egibacteraceae bacterium]
MPPRVALATARAAWGLDPDEPALLAALAGTGVEAAPVAWDDPHADWAAWDLVVLRSTWDYAERREAFLAWAERVEAATRLANPLAVVRANTDKRYLAALAAAGVPVVDTAFFAPGEEVVLPERGEAVVKPAVSAGSRDTLRTRPGERERPLALARRLHAEGRTVMVQPYVASVDVRGETAVCYLDGAFSHAVAKGPILPPGADVIDGLHAPEDLASREPTAAERAVADAALAALDAEGLLYARVDVVDGADEAPEVLEVELTEPSLFLRYAAGSVERFAAAIAARAGSHARR